MQNSLFDDLEGAAEPVAAPEPEPAPAKKRAPAGTTAPRTVQALAEEIRRLLPARH